MLKWKPKSLSLILKHFDLYPCDLAASLWISHLPIRQNGQPHLPCLSCRFDEVTIRLFPRGESTWLLTTEVLKWGLWKPESRGGRKLVLSSGAVSVINSGSSYLCKASTLPSPQLLISLLTLSIFAPFFSERSLSWCPRQAILGCRMHGRLNTLFLCKCVFIIQARESITGNLEGRG